MSADGINTLMERAMKALTYKSLCFPDEIRAREMEDAPKYYYKDDGMMIWKEIRSFVTELVRIYYDSDEAVKKDVEIQAFVKDIYKGLRENKGFPQSLHTRDKLIKYLTAMIFTGSAQHAAVNFGQLCLVTDKIYKHFTEQPAKEAIMNFQEKLGEVKDHIKRRNAKLTMPYGYLSPNKIPNSVAI